MTYPFHIIEHVIPGQHIREYPHATKGRQEVALQLAIKQYIPRDQANPIPDNAVTIIAVHGNGFPKETYEPLWEDLYTQLKKQSVPVRGIWIADVSNQGASGVLNEDVQGDNTNWYDHSRDLLHMVNHFRDEMPRPIIGVGHSMGCTQLIHLSIIHPRLLSTLVLFEPTILEPVIAEAASGGPNPSTMAVRRRDIWNTREKAESSLRKGLSKWDPRALNNYLKFGLRPVPTPLYPETTPEVPASAVTLTTTKHQEAWAYAIPNLEPESAGLDHLLLPDWDPVIERPQLFSRPEGWSAMQFLPFLRPSVLWGFGGGSFYSLPVSQDAKVRVTGSGVGGSGGAAVGMVEKVVLEKGSHLIVFEDVGWCAGVAEEWIGRWFKEWLKQEEFWRTYKSKKSDGEMLRGSEAWMKVVMAKSGTKRSASPKGKL